jgi:phosphate starvation-inducible PhoH-like protein
LQVNIKLEPIHRKLELFGPADVHLKLLRKNLDVQITARNEILTIAGRAENVNATAEVLDKMQKHLIRSDSLSADDVEFFIEERGRAVRQTPGEAVTV